MGFGYHFIGGPWSVDAILKLKTAIENSQQASHLHQVVLIHEDAPTRDAVRMFSRIGGVLMKGMLGRKVSITERTLQSRNSMSDAVVHVHLISVVSV